MLSAYPACFIKDDTGYSVIFPDLNDLATSGTTQADALAMAVDCLAGYLFWLEKDGEIPPAASDMGSIDPYEIAKELDVTCDNAFVNMIMVDVAEYAKRNFEKAVKKTLTIPSWLNQAALEQGINFSQTLQEALLEKLYGSRTTEEPSIVSCSVTYSEVLQGEFGQKKFYSRDRYKEPLQLIG